MTFIDFYFIVLILLRNYWWIITLLGFISFGYIVYPSFMKLPKKDRALLIYIVIGFFICNDLIALINNPYTYIKQYEHLFYTYWKYLKIVGMPIIILIIIDIIYRIKKKHIIQD